jgi:hypothetical protein
MCEYRTRSTEPTKVDITRCSSCVNARTARLRSVNTHSCISRLICISRLMLNTDSQYSYQQ